MKHQDILTKLTIYCNEIVSLERVHESTRVNVDEIIDTMGGVSKIKKKFKDLKSAMTFVKKNLNDFAETFGINVSEFPMKVLETKLKSVFEE